MGAIRAFQSLLSQGISLLPCRCAKAIATWRRRFNPFLVRASVYWLAAPGAGQRQSLAFQSLLSQGISLLVKWSHKGEARTQYMFQSLLSQGISLLTRHPGDTRVAPPDSFNPFLVRASVYCVPTTGASLVFFSTCFNPFLVRASVYCQEPACRGASQALERFNPFLVRASVYWVSGFFGFSHIGSLVSIPS